jgi:HPt (histidine-containing phosphotransfer) domain-containing protein
MKEKKAMTTPPAGTNPGTLETAMMDRIRQLGIETEPDFVLELIDSYSPLFERLHNSLLESHSKKDRGKIQYAAHSLKGASLNIGASDLGAICITIEDLAEKEEYAAIDPLLLRLDAELKKTNSALLTIRTRISQGNSPK